MDKLKPLCEMTDIELDNILQAVVFNMKWEKTEDDLVNEDMYSAFYFEELRANAVEFLNFLTEKYKLSKRQLLRARNAVYELLTNCERHMAVPFYNSLVIAYREDCAIVLHVENSSTEMNAKAALDCLQEITRTAFEDLETLRDKLLQSPKIGGMGIWNIITQLKCDLWIRYDKRVNGIESFCYISEGSSSS